VTGPGILQRRIPSSVVWGLAILLMTLAGAWMQSRVHLNHDVSYFVHFSRWLLQGRTLGVDLQDGNLPMVWGLFMPSAALAQSSLFSEPSAVRLVFWAYFLLSTAMTMSVLSRSDGKHFGASAGWIAAFVLVATLAPGFSFGQREHASVLFAMPYLAAAVLRLQGARFSGKFLPIAIGVLAGVGFALKPYFLAIPALVELLLLVRLGWRSLFERVESLVFGCTVLLYVIAAALLIPEYLEFTLGLTRYSYWAYSTDNVPFIFDRYVGVAQPVLFGGLIAMITRTWSRQHTVMLLGVLGYTASYFVQAKGFVYQAYPVLVCSITFVGICVGQGLARAWAEWRATRGAGRLAVVAAAIALVLPPFKSAHDDIVDWYFTYNVAHGPIGQFRQAVIDVVNHFAPTSRSYFFAFTTHPFPAFPTASYSTAEYAGRSISQSFIPAYARLDEVSDPVARERIVGAAEYQRRTVVEDFERRPPSVVLVERNPSRLGMNGRQFDDIAFYRTDPRFQKIWANYEEYPPMGPLRVFVLRSGRPQQPGDSKHSDAAAATATAHRAS
jgi:hypothetical protein